MSIMISIPPPPTANLLWRRGKNSIYRSKEYEAWILECKLRLGSAKESAATPVMVKIEIHGGKGFPKSRDLDNCIKPVIDLLRHLGILENDRVTELPGITARYIPRDTKSLAECYVSITSLETQTCHGAELT